MNSKPATTHCEEDVISLPEGLVGLPTLRRWVLTEMDPPLPLKWLQSLDRPGFRVPMTDPGYFDQDYAFELDDRAERLLDSPKAEDLVVMIVTTIHQGGERITGNLTAPVVVNVKNHSGLQCILTEQNYCLHQEIDYVRFGADVVALEELNDDSETPNASSQEDCCVENQEQFLVRT